MRILPLVLLFLAVSCKFNYSPYMADTPTIKLNKINLERIKAIEATTPSNFKVAVLADTHNYYEELDEIITRLNRDGSYTFVIIAGDVTNLGLIDEFDESRNFFNKLKYPVIVAQGNHDRLSNGKDIFRKMFGSTDFSLEFKNVQFVLFNNNNWESPGIVPDKDWVMRELSSSPASIKILVAHVSPNDPERFDKDFKDDWIGMVNAYNIQYFINGHDHNPIQGTFGNATQITVGAPSKRVYLELIFSSGGVTHQVRYL